MPLPSSGTISLSQVNTELGRSSTANISLGETAVRNLFGVASGAISMSQGYGKANAFAATITTNQKEMNLRTWALANGWNGASSATITIASGVYIWSDNRNIAALTTGSFPGGLTIINNGFIIGRGGNGDYYSGSAVRVTGTSGGPALSLSQNVTIQNNSYIAGGGGGGGGVSIGGPGGGTGCGGGGGAGGGVGGSTFHDSLRGTVTLAGGTGGAIGASGGTGAPGYQAASGGGGGRILPGTGGVKPTNATGGGGGGAGGGGGLAVAVNAPTPATMGYGAGGGGGGWGASGGSARNNISNGSAAAGGSANNVGESATGGGATVIAGQAGGNSVALNGFSVTWTATGNRWGAIS